VASIKKPIDKLRVYIGDTDPADQLLTDDEAKLFLADHTFADDSVDVYAAAADAAYAIAAKFSRGFNFSTEGQSFNRSERVNHYTALAGRLSQQSPTLGGRGASVAVGSPTYAAVSGSLVFGEVV
jgi:hypothetical protein